MKKIIAEILALSMLLIPVSSLAEAASEKPAEGEISPSEILTVQPETQPETEVSLQENVIPAEVLTPAVPNDTAQNSEEAEEIEPAAGAELPPVGNIYYWDDFSGSEINERIVTATSAGGTITLTGGALTLNKEVSNSGWSGMDIFLNTDHSTVKMDEFVTQFTVKRSEKLPKVNIRMRGAGGDFTGLTWGSGKNVSLYYSNEKGKDNKDAVVLPNAAEYGKATSLKFTVYYNTVNQTFTLWINDELVVQDKYPRYAKVNDIQYIRIYMEKDAGSLSVDDFMFYDLKELSDEERVAQDAKALRHESIFGGKEVLPGVIADNISLPKSGLSGSTITWESSHPEIISADGEVTRPGTEYPENPEVTLTATVSSGSAKQTKVFKIRVLKELSDEDRVAEDAEDLTYESIFGGKEILPGMIADDISLPKFGQSGSTITWESSHPEIISADGKVTRPGEEYPENPEVTLTATVSSGSAKQTKVFKICVLKANINIGGGKPVIDSMIYENDFSSGELDAHISPTLEGGTVTAEEGVLKITRNENKGNTIADIYVNEDKTAVSGYLGITYTLKKEGTGIVQQRIRKESYNDFIAITWNANNTVSCMAADEEGGKVQTYNLKGEYDVLNVSLLIDTMRGTVNLWLDDQHVLKDKYSRVAPGNMVTYLRFYMEGKNLLTAKLDDLKVFNAVLSPVDRIIMDKEWLTAERLLTKPYVKDNIIDADLNLMTKGENKSNISWTSSAPEYISADGKIHQPVDVDEQPEVTLTATIESEGISVTKEFKFRVQNVYSTDEKRLEAEIRQFDEKFLMSLGDTDPSKIRASLNLPENGMYGTTISWKSSNRNVITNSGRVIRPRNDKPAETVTLTAVFKIGGKSAEKKMEFTVLPDDPWVDPNHMTDEAFYGKWENEAWKTAGKLDYSKPELASVEAAVKAGDYAKAKEEMLRYMSNRSVESPVKLGARESGWANYAIADIQNLQGNAYYQGEGTVSSYDYQPVYIPVKTGKIAKGGTTSYAIIAKYNEISTALIAGAHHPNPEYRPKMEITVNGKKTIRDATSGVTIRAGAYKNLNYFGEEDLKAKMFGEFLGDETYKAMLRFDLKDLSDSDTVSDVRLILHAKLAEDFADPKDLIAVFEPNAFNEKKATWNSFTGYVYNFNGLPEGTTWGSIPGADVEYGYQMPRFLAWRCLGTEYNATKDEKYAYYMIDSMMDFIKKKGGRTTEGQGWPQDPEIMAGFPRTLDTAERMRNWSATMNTIAKSKSMTPEACTVILKTMWHMTNSMLKSKTGSGNWKQNEKMAILQTAISFPEFADSRKWLENARVFNEDMFTKENNYPDGSYIEKTAGYSQSSLSSYIDFKRLMLSQGMDVSPEYDAMLQKSAYYNLQLYGPGGQNLQWGDDSAGRRKGEKYPEISKWYNDKELLYIDSFGKKGEKPDWTSMSFPDGRNTFMRSDWTKNALYLYTNVRGTGGHAHQDDNGVIVMAYDRILLPDSGIFTYTKTDPDRIYGISTRAHNTVEVNNRSGSAPGRGPIHNWVTNDKYDFLSQSSTGYEPVGVGHRRSILFIKPDLWIVSDLMTPKNKTGKNTYKQLWHMLPDANLAIDGENRLITSNFKTGANILIGSADSDAAVKEAMGRYDFGYQQVTDAKYGYYEKENVVGDAVFDTVLLPDRANKNELHVERIDLGAAASEATAIKFDTTIDGEKNKFYYLLDYNHKTGEKNTFEKYRTDGKLALVREGQNGKIQDIVLNEGQKLETAEGDLVLETKGSLADLSLRQIGARVYFDTTAEASALKGTKLKLDNVKTVYVNDQAVAFRSEADGTIVLSDSPEEVVPPRDPSSGHGGIGGGGGGGGTGGGNGGTVTPPEPTEKPGTTDPEPEKDGLTDIQGHWAEEMIQELYTKGIVNGDTEKRFHPDMPVTRAEFLAMMLRAEGIEEKEYRDSFLDVHAEDWYSGIVQAGLDNGIISADTEFRPMDQITREEMCKILVLSAGDKLEKPENPEEYVLAFGDAEEISDWAVEYVKIAAYHKLIEGKETGEFEPLNTATRAESAAVLARLLRS